MKNTFKPLALAAAVAGMSAGMAHAGSYPSLGDAAFVPYYTVEGDWVTGVHITNTSNQTQIVKLRLRRAEDSLDILDFNLILSPYDVWTGTISGDEEEMRFITEDDSCTAPVLLDNGDGRTYAPVFGPRIPGAQEGYLEVIGMAATTDEGQPIAEAALHDSDGIPDDCDEVRDNFFVAAVVSNDETQISGSDGTSTYVDVDNVLKVSYFVRDDATGIEFGNNAIHFEDFAADPMMTHQQYGLENYSNASAINAPNDALIGWDFPDVRGGGFNAPRASIDVVRAQLGAESVLNDWSYNPATGAATDWVITFPGQYALVDYWQLEGELAGDDDSVWDYREIPVLATFEVYDREEQSAIPGGLNFSPSPAPDTTTLEYEVNVIEWGGQSVLDSNFVTPVNPEDAGIDAPYGWANLVVVANSGPSDGLLAPGDNGWCDVAAGPDIDGGINGEDSCPMTAVTGPVPMVGFAAWERTFSEDADRNYGRIVEHSFNTSN